MFVYTWSYALQARKSHVGLPVIRTFFPQVGMERFVS